MCALCNVLLIVVRDKLHEHDISELYKKARESSYA